MRNETKQTFLDRVGDRIDRFVTAVSPERGLRRKAHRAAIKAYAANVGASTIDRRMYNWVTVQDSADSALLWELSKLRERSNDLARNNPLVAGSLDNIASHEIGKGLQPQSRVSAVREQLGLSEDQAKAFEHAAEDAWSLWSRHVDYSSRLHMEDLQYLATLERLRTGEAIFVRRSLEARTSPYQTRWEMVAPERLCSPSEFGDLDLRQGVEIGRRGQPVAYWFLKQHPVDPTRWATGFRKEDFVRVPAIDKDGFPRVLHIYHTTRVGQSRGRPLLGPVIARLKDLGGYQDSEWVAARAAACIAQVVYTRNPSEMAVAQADETDSSGVRYEDMEPGQRIYLADGQEMTTFAPNRPGEMYEAFIRSALQEIAAGMNIPYQLLINDWGDMNFSSARIALMQAWKVFRRNQAVMARYMTYPMWESLHRERWLKGEIAAPNWLTERALWCRVEWHGPVYEYVDPQKEAGADARQAIARLSSRKRLMARRGIDWDEEFAQMAAEREQMVAAGLTEEDIDDADTGSDRSPDAVDG